MLLLEGKLFMHSGHGTNIGLVGWSKSRKGYLDNVLAMLEIIFLGVGLVLPWLCDFSFAGQRKFRQSETFKIFSGILRILRQCWLCF